MKTIIVTGSAGLIGSEASKFFHQKEFRVVGIDNNIPNKSRYYLPKLDYFQRFTHVISSMSNYILKLRIIFKHFSQHIHYHVSCKIVFG